MSKTEEIKRYLVEWIRPSGYFNQKATYLKGIIVAIRRDFDGSIEQLFELNTHSLRMQLLSWEGIGP